MGINCVIFSLMLCIKSLKIDSLHITPMLCSYVRYVLWNLKIRFLLNKIFKIQIVVQYPLPSTLNHKYRHFDEIFVTGCTGSCHFDNFQCSQWWKFHQNEDISVSVHNLHWTGILRLHSSQKKKKNSMSYYQILFLGFKDSCKFVISSRNIVYNYHYWMLHKKWFS